MDSGLLSRTGPPPDTIMVSKSPAREPRVNALERQERAQQQARAAQQEHGDGHPTDGQRASKTCAGTGDSSPIVVIACTGATRVTCQAGDRP